MFKAKSKCWKNCKLLFFYFFFISSNLKRNISTLNIVNFCRPELKPIEKEGEVTLKFPEVESLSPPILQLSEVSFRYEGTSSSYIFTDVNLTGSLQSRICIVGENGAGKTTLLKIITGALSATRGTVHIHRNLKFGYFSQHHVDTLDMRVCSVELLQNHFPGNFLEIDLFWYFKDAVVSLI